MLKAKLTGGDDFLKTKLKSIENPTDSQGGLSTKKSISWRNSYDNKS